MDKKTALVFGTLFAAGIIIMFCVLREREKELLKENEDLAARLQKVEADRILLIQDSISRNPEISDVIERQLLDLASQFKNISPTIANEIHQALELLQLERKEDAIADLARIMENLLKEYYQNHIGFNQWIAKKSPSFHTHLEYCCREDKKINEVEFQFYRAVKTIRNKEAHELAVNLGENINASGLLSAISGISKLSSLAYPA